MKKIIRLTEHDLFKIVKRVINEQDGDNDNYKVYAIQPFEQGPVTLYVAVKDGKIYSYNARKGTIGEQIGGWDTPDQARQAAGFVAHRRKKGWIDPEIQRKKGIEPSLNPIFDAGWNYVYNANNQQSTQLYFRNRVSDGDFRGYAFIFESQSNVPQLIGFHNSGEILYGTTTYPMEVTTIKTTPPPPPPPPPVEPEDITLDLKNLFHYDCPTPQNPGNETFTCGRTSRSNNTPTGGSDAQPFTDQKKAEDMINKFGKALLSVKNFSTIRDKTFYVIGFASAEGTTQHNFMLSLSRAEYVANMLTEITGGKIRFVGVGKGATTVFGTDLPSNRRVIVATNPESISPATVKIRKDGYGNVTSVSVIPGKV